MVNLTTNKKGFFLKGPIPWTWLETASEMGGKATQVVLALFMMKGLKDSRTFILEGKWLRGLRLGRHSVYKYLALLEQRGFISQLKGAGKRTRITLNLPEKDWW